MRAKKLASSQEALRNKPIHSKLKDVSTVWALRPAVKAVANDVYFEMLTCVVL